MQNGDKKQAPTARKTGTLIGSAVYDHIPGLEVDLDTPDYELFVEVRDFGGLVYNTRIAGPGGLPWGTQGRVLALLSSGIDSPVASWLMMKRGCGITRLPSRCRKVGGKGCHRGGNRKSPQVIPVVPGISPVSGNCRQRTPV